MEKIRAKKALGQNFLVDGNVIANIIRAADVGSDDRVLEIGPGKGAITSRLAGTAARVVAVERDRELVPLLRNSLGEYDNIQIVHGDILRTDLSLLLPPSGPGSGRWWPTFPTTSRPRYFSSSSKTVPCLLSCC